MRQSIGHRLEPEGMRMRLDEPPELDTPVEIELTYDDGRIALLGIGWVSGVEPDDTHFELEWASASDQGLLQELFGADRPAPTSRTVSLEELESPDEVRLVPSGPVESGRFHPDLEWAISEDALANTLGFRGEDEDATPLSLTEVVESDDPVPFLPTRPLPVQLPEPLPLTVDLPSSATTSAGSTPLARIDLKRRDDPEPSRPGSVSPSPEPQPLPRRTIRTPRGEPAGPLLGIDLGTSLLSMAALSKSGKPRVLPLEPGSVSMPSVVTLAPDGEAYAGAAALRMLSDHPSWGVSGTHRLLGRSFWSPTVRRVEPQLAWQPRPGPDGGVVASVEDRAIALEEAVALVLRRAVRSARAEIGKMVNRAVLTCPAYYGVRQRAALVEAAELAGLFVERVVSTCSAVAVHHEAGVDVGRRRRLLVFDLGAGTLDVAVVETDGLRFTTLASGGHPLLGGADFDAAVGQLMVGALEGRGA
ncbi:MAG: Hsp70 family protein, partial [Myxococcota bacterium]